MLFTPSQLNPNGTDLLNVAWARGGLIGADHINTVKKFFFDFLKLYNELGKVMKFVSSSLILSWIKWSPKMCILFLLLYKNMSNLGQVKPTFVNYHFLVFGGFLSEKIQSGSWNLLYQLVVRVIKGLFSPNLLTLIPKDS